MKFYLKVDGKLVERVWCDNVHCPNYICRSGIQSLNRLVTIGEKDFCSPLCQKRQQWDETRGVGQESD